MTNPLTAFSLTKPIHISRLFCQNLSASGDCFVTHETYLHQPTDLSLREPSSICWLFFNHKTYLHQPTVWSVSKPISLSRLFFIHETYLHQPTILSVSKPISISQLFFHSRNLSALADYFVSLKIYQHQPTVFNSRQAVLELLRVLLLLLLLLLLHQDFTFCWNSLIFVHNLLPDLT